MRIQLAQSGSAQDSSGQAPADLPAVPDAQTSTGAGTGDPGSPQAPVSVPPETPPVESQGEPVGAFQSMIDGVSGFIDLGGPVVALLLVLSVFALAIILLKLWQFYVAGGSSKQDVSKAISLWFAGDADSEFIGKIITSFAARAVSKVLMTRNDGGWRLAFTMGLG